MQRSVAKQTKKVSGGNVFNFINLHCLLITLYSLRWMLSSHESHRSPIQAHRYTPGAALGLRVMAFLLLPVLSIEWFHYHHLSIVPAPHQVPILIHLVYTGLPGMVFYFMCQKWLTSTLLSPRLLPKSPS